MRERATEKSSGQEEKNLTLNSCCVEVIRGHDPQVAWYVTSWDMAEPERGKESFPPPVRSVIDPASMKLGNVWCASQLALHSLIQTRVIYIALALAHCLWVVSMPRFLKHQNSIRFDTNTINKSETLSILFLQKRSRNIGQIYPDLHSNHGMITKT